MSTAIRAAAAACPATAGCHPRQFGVDPIRRRGTEIDHRGAVEQVEELAPHQHMLFEGNGPLLGDDHVGVAAHCLEPVAELFRVRDGGAERHHLDGPRQVDDDFLPDRPAEAIGQEMHLVHHDVGEVPEQRRVRVEHVAQHLGGHHDHARRAVDVAVTGEQSDRLCAVFGG